MEELKRVDVINQQAKYGREAEFKLGTDQEIAAKVRLWEVSWIYHTPGTIGSEMCLGQSISQHLPAGCHSERRLCPMSLPDPAT